ncbi:T-box-containing protein TBX6L-like isoform X2 [Erythrolamprus reginae]|uniref:T-box-containing protein TBX6L-like isoform X2 n=1 Tax=Erythrolamprus reginae TaxID=121349 RepID=UPI00396CE2FC
MLAGREALRGFDGLPAGLCQALDGPPPVAGARHPPLASFGAPLGGLADPPPARLHKAPGCGVRRSCASRASSSTTAGSPSPTGFPGAPAEPGKMQVGSGFQAPSAPLETPSVPPRSSVAVALEEEDLWAKFHHAGTEMIITKTGRRMFPPFKVRVTGLVPCARYLMLVDFVPTDNFRYKWNKDQWEIAGKAEPQPPRQTSIHPDSPALGGHWMKEPVSFQKLKLTNNTWDQQGHVVLHSMHRYEPRLHIVQADGFFSTHRSTVHSFSFPETVFTAVTAYQNGKITKLKIYNNPFAKGFREHGKSARHRGRSGQGRNPAKVAEMGAPPLPAGEGAVKLKAKGSPPTQGPVWLSGPSGPPEEQQEQPTPASSSWQAHRFPAAGEESLPTPFKDLSTFDQFWARPHQLDFPMAPEQDPKPHEGLAATPLLPLWQDHAGMTGHAEEPAGKPKSQGLTFAPPDQSFGRQVAPPSRSFAPSSAGHPGSTARGRADWTQWHLIPYAPWPEGPFPEGC